MGGCGDERWEGMVVRDGRCGVVVREGGCEW